jgi:hypothetical protein
MYPLNMTSGIGYAVANDEAEHQALTDMGYGPAFVAVGPTPSDEELLRAELTAKGIKFDKRWGADKLQAALESAE